MKTKNVEQVAPRFHPFLATWPIPMPASIQRETTCSLAEKHKRYTNRPGQYDAAGTSFARSHPVRISTAQTLGDYTRFYAICQITVAIPA
jgi:hypothetical protein